MGSLTFHVIFFLLYSCRPGYGLICYQCGMEGRNENCSQLNFFMYSIGDCGKNEYCSKVLHEAGTVVRGCASRDTAVEQHKHELGCWMTKPQHTDTRIIFTCFCDTDYCNDAQLSFLSPVLLIASFCTAACLRF